MQSNPDSGPLAEDRTSAQAGAVEAANEEFTSARQAQRTLAQEPHAGWDPYEVWRTRIKPVPSKS